jgi:hypothetical protein
MSVIKTNEITKGKIAEILEGAGISVDISDDGNEVYAKHGGVAFGAWVQLPDENIPLRIFTFLQCKDNAPTDALPELVAKMNSFNLVKFTFTTYDDGRAFVNGTYDIFSDFGIIDKQLVITLKGFSDIFLAAISEFDKENIFFS